jgi:hypothetical protein
MVKVCVTFGTKVTFFNFLRQTLFFERTATCGAFFSGFSHGFPPLMQTAPESVRYPLLPHIRIGIVDIYYRTVAKQRLK